MCFPDELVNNNVLAIDLNTMFSVSDHLDIISMGSIYRSAADANTDVYVCWTQLSNEKPHSRAQ